MILAFDLSSTVVGYSIFDKEYNLIKLSFEKLIGKTILEKAEYLENFINSLLQEFPITEFVIEDRLKNFQKGKSSDEVILTLGFINVFGQYIIYKHRGIEITGLNVRHARALVFPGFHKIARASKMLEEKELAFEFARKILGESYFTKRIITKGKDKEKEVYTTECGDMTDSYILGKAYIIEKYGRF